MRLKKVEIIKFRNFENIVIDFEKSDFPSVYTIASKNGGGKSTLIQFIFTILHCFMDEEKKEYIKNILEEFSDIIQHIELVKFIIEEDGKEYNLDFNISGSKDEDKNYNLYLDLSDTQNDIKKYKNNFKKYQQILDLQQDMEENKRITPLIDRNLRYVREFISSKREDDLYRQARTTNDLNIYKKLVDTMIEKNSISKDKLNELEEIYSRVQQNIEEQEILLESENIIYITHLLKNKNVLLLKTNMNKELLEDLTNKIFLTAPISQIFLFLSNETKHEIFNEFLNQDSYAYNSYYDGVKKSKKFLNGFYTYDFASTELILDSFRKASQEDFKIKRRTGKYGTKHDELTNELKGLLDGKEIKEDEDGKRVIFKIKDQNEELKPEDLSHGELKKLGLYIWLKYIVEENSIILMDEVDIALHPKWQYQLINDLTEWSKNSQFLLATHSPQILSSTYYKNIIKLENGKVKRYNKPPIDRDINAIIVEIMEAPDFPQDLLELHKKYRKLINDGKVDTDEAKELKEKILEYESESSSFFQEINFDLELM